MNSTHLSTPAGDPDPTETTEWTDAFAALVAAQGPERALDRIFILHADHEQNASTSTVRLCGSSGTNPFAAIAAGVACLWGPAHGGANEACLEMLGDIQQMGGVAKVGEFMNQVKDKNSGVKLMGFGHRG